jgi:glycerol uptake facilitator-like aquaporin
VTAPGCFGPAKDVTNGELFWWEVFMTFLLVITVYAAAVSKPGHGNTAPLAIGLSLYAAALTGEWSLTDVLMYINLQWALMHGPIHASSHDVQPL